MLVYSVWAKHQDISPCISTSVCAHTCEDDSNPLEAVVFSVLSTTAVEPLETVLTVVALLPVEVVLERLALAVSLSSRAAAAVRGGLGR